MHGIEIFESPNLNIMAKLKLYPIKIHIPELGPQAVANCSDLLLNNASALYVHASPQQIY